MKVLVTGASGLIGSALCARLSAERHDVVRVLHRAGAGFHLEIPSILLDMTRALRLQGWIPHFAGVDAVVNCAGVLQVSARENTRDVHSTGAAALFGACEQASVNKVIHFSALASIASTIRLFRQ
ncbi:NAD-dependent epimerase/dehydratase family protein [Mesorhizobium sp. ORM8.1]